MSVVIQSSSDSLRSAASESVPAAGVTVPPAIVAGDMVCVAVSSTASGSVKLIGRQNGSDVDEPLPGLVFQSFVGTSGDVHFGYAHVPSRAVAEGIKALDELVVSIVDGSGALVGDEHQLTVAVFRVTGADTRRFVEDAKSVTGDLAAEGELTIPNFDPEHRRDNTLLFISTATFPHDTTAPRITAARSTPVATVTAQPNAGDDDSLGVTTAISIRALASADPTGAIPVAYSSQPVDGLGVALMLRSANRPPVVNLPAEWAAEVGREAVVSATISDPDQTPVSYVWSQISGPEPVTIGNVYARAFTFTPSLPGIYRFILRATDVDGGRTELETSVIVPTGTTGPAAVTVADGWVDQDGGTVDPAELDDKSDATFARTVDLPVGKPLTVLLNPIYGGAAVTLTVRGAASNPSPAIRRTLTLKQSDGLVIAERSYVLPTVMGSYVFETTRNETALITNRSAMTLTIVDEVA